MHLIRCVVIGAVLVSVFPALAEEPAKQPEKTKQEAVVAGEKCRHGVKKTLCTRCNPQLEGEFKARGDWCEEHKRADSQCARCNKELEKQGVKP